VGKAVAVVVAVILIIATLYMLYEGEFTSIISRIIQSPSPSTNVTAAKTSTYIPETTTTGKPITSTNRTLTKVQGNLSTTTSKVTTTYSETKTEQVATSYKVNVTKAGEEFINISTSAEVTQLFSINAEAMLRPEQIFLYINGTHMVAGAKGLIVSLAFYRPESTVPSYEIVPIGERKPGVILADYVYINNSLTLLTVKLSEGIKYCASRNLHSHYVERIRIKSH